MKRDGRGNPVVTVHRWNRPPLSCSLCRQKKRRCDRNQPCSNCRQRDVPCEYARDGGFGTDGHTLEADPLANATQIEPASNAEGALSRIRRLEDAVFPDNGARSAISVANVQMGGIRDDVTKTTLFGMSLLPSDPPLDIALMLAQLPPLGQARVLTSHFAQTMQQTIAIFHMPSTRVLIEQAYDTISRGGTPTLEDLLTLFVVFAGAAHACTPQILEQLGATEDTAGTAFTVYTRLAMQIVSHPPLSPSTTCLAAMATLLQLLISADGIPIAVHVVHSRYLVMALMVQLHKLDAAGRRNGYDLVEAEVQRRVWWDVVATDWLNSFCGPFEGAYIFHPRHMAVNYPANIDDDELTPSTQECDLNAPLDTPTNMSAFLQRIKLADLSRETIDTLPSMLLDQDEANYSSILALDAKFHAYLDAIPVFYRLDTPSMLHSEAFCTARPVIRHQRIGVHLAVHIRLCRLHRPYYLRGRIDPRYAPSHAACVTSACTVLDLRRAMDDVSTLSGTRPARLWKVAQHVFSAALVLAADVALDPAGADAGVRREQVLSACRTLHESTEGSVALREHVQMNLQTLMATLRGEDGSRGSLLARPKGQDGNGVSVEGISQDTADNDWDALWADFLDVVPELDVQGWDALLGNIDFGLSGVGA